MRGICGRRQHQLYDHQAEVQSLVGSGLPQLDKTTREPKQFMAIITAPVLVADRLATDSSAAAAAMRLMRDPFTLESNTQQKRS